jgi:hypothetical protein
MSDGRRPARKTYEPPVVRKVKLVAGEIAVAGCKAVQVAPNFCRKGAQIFMRTIGS